MQRLREATHLKFCLSQIKLYDEKSSHILLLVLVLVLVLLDPPGGSDRLPLLLLRGISGRSAQPRCSFDIYRLQCRLLQRESVFENSDSWVRSQPGSGPQCHQRPEEPRWHQGIGSQPWRRAPALIHRGDRPSSLLACYANQV